MLYKKTYLVIFNLQNLFVKNLVLKFGNTNKLNFYKNVFYYICKIL